MNYRYATLLAQTEETADKVETIDLDINDVISRIDLFYRYSASKHGMDTYGYADILKIEVVDGSDVLFSLSGGECQALNIYNRKVPTMQHGQHWEGNAEFQMFGLDFGRFLWDPELAFDPTRFTNPQLKVHIDFGTSDTGISTSYLTAKAHMFDDKKVSPRGFLMPKEHFSYTIGSDGSYEYVELPKDYPIRRMLIKAYASGYEPWYQIEAVRLDLDNEAKIPFDMAVEEYHRMRKGVDPLVMEHFIAQIAAGSIPYYITPTDYYCGVYGTSSETVTPYYDGYPRGGKVTLMGASGTQIFGEARGYLPNHCVNFPMGMENDIADWFNPMLVGKARLRLEAGTGATGTGAVVLEQFRPY